MLSQDTACQRLTQKGHALRARNCTKNIWHLRKRKKYQDFLKQIKNKTKHNNKPTTGEDLLKRTDLTTSEIKLLLKVSKDKEEFFKRAANEIKYSGYIAKQKREVESS